MSGVTVSDPRTSPFVSGRARLALCWGLGLCAATMAMGGPALHYLPGEGAWTWHPPAGVETMSALGWALNALLGGGIGWSLGGLGRVARWLERAQAALGWALGATLCVTLALAVGQVSPPDAQERSMARPLRAGDALPAFSLQSSRGETVTHADLLGRGPVVIYFYPRDETTGCTAQACGFRDSYEVFTDAGAEVVGVSSDSVASHLAFAEHHRLPFLLLADPDDTLRRAFGVPRTLGLIHGRVTYVIDKGGTIQHVFDSQMQVLQHVTEALAVVQRLAK